MFNKCQQLLLPLLPPAGVFQVVYDVRGMLQKNRDTFRDDILNLLRESRSVCSSPLNSVSFPADGRHDDDACVFARLDFVYDLFEHVQSRNKQETLKSSSKHRRPTVISQFKVRNKQLSWESPAPWQRQTGGSNSVWFCCRILYTL